jgi:hypothetical protein
MTDLRILFADDQIPPENIPDEDVRSVLKERNPQWSDAFISAFVVMRQAVNALRDAGYDLSTATTYDEALRLVGQEHFDIAIIDLGWFADARLPASKQRYAGWDICREIDRADQESEVEPTLQIVFSDRFLKDATISMQAADRGKLPVFKNYTNPTAGQEALKAAVKFIEGNLAQPSDLVRMFRGWASDLGKRILESYDESIKRERQWSTLTMVFIALSVIILLGGVVGAILLGTQIEILTSAASIVSGLISTLFLAQLRRSQDLNKENVGRLEGRFQEALQQLIELSTTEA